MTTNRQYRRLPQEHIEPRARAYRSEWEDAYDAEREASQNVRRNGRSNGTWQPQSGAYYNAGTYPEDDIYDDWQPQRSAASNRGAASQRRAYANQDRWHDDWDEREERGAMRNGRSAAPPPPQGGGRPPYRRKNPAARIALLLGVLLVILIAVILLLRGCGQQGGPAVSPSPDATQSPAISPSQSPAATPTPEQQAYDYSKPVPQREAVEDSYFADAVFIGDSRTEGFLMYSGLKGTQSLYYTGLNVHSIFNNETIAVDGKKVPVMTALEGMNFKKVYIMLGVNELGWPSAHTFAVEYAKVIDKILEINPDAQVYVQAIIPVTQAKSDASTVYTNDNVKKFNEEILAMTEEKRVYYVDTANGLAPDGVLPADAAVDGVHLKKDYCVKWLEYLRTHTVEQ